MDAFRPRTPRDRRRFGRPLGLRFPLPARSALGGSRLIAGSLFLTLTASAGAAAAQQELLCADPRGFCSLLIRPVCLERIQAEELDDEKDPDCGGALIAYRACLSDAVDCPGVEDQDTPTISTDAAAPCVGDCDAGPAPAPVIRQTPDGPAMPEDEEADQLGQ